MNALKLSVIGVICVASLVKLLYDKTHNQNSGVGLRIRM
jgi:hypothetical protein